MWRATKLILLTALFLALAWWVCILPGTVTAQAGPYTINASLPAALILLVAAMALLTMLVRVIGGIWRTPVHFKIWRDQRKTTAGDIALQRSLTAIAAEDARKALAEATRAAKHLGDQPLVLLARAEAERLAGHRAEAAALFEALTKTSELHFLGHQGLHKLEMAAPEGPASKRHLQNAEAAYPDAPWVRAQQLSQALQAHDYAAALPLATQPSERAALATAAARAAASPETGLSFCRQALKAVPDFIPALTTMAALLRATDHAKAARKLLLKAWRAHPHALLAQAWTSPEATALSIAQDAVYLAEAVPKTLESELYLAQTALAAGLKAEANRHATHALSLAPESRRAKAMLTAMQNNTPLPPAGRWQCTACRATSDEWEPICPICQKLGTLQWGEPQ
ncbi:heme biosynthesis HemY N-terminal domain-containing protein [Acidocella sp.]|uniref:heme biosynthesis HemY N-terminal domain-containing protein n=1 Tax=Acidocella sp. TaxID=50710 RepID=UPI002603DFCC|nr:heme biosynthesis HemY N-terminal domain-containing protein [Acidocella sp.]